MRTKRKNPPSRPRGRTNQDRAHKAAVLVSTFLGIAGVLAVGVGGYAWSLDRPAPVRISGTEGHRVAATPLFDSGVTLFGSEAIVPDGGALDWGCVLTQDGARTRLTHRADIEQAGSRVHDDESLLPALDAGVTGDDAVISCTSLPEEGEVWALPTDTGPPQIPLSLVIAGIGGIGLSVLVHPRTRGLVRFS
ncbi:hypothetical protein [Janibacter corallicola]|uniref:hypothetical protein n=1 Tax=Janibacter corallicola TaxID=415212 RepID=UPI000A5490E7|nr:hypothetical protein [Janibacter corallicola]